jgi:pilus assembly protein Flp/PilA
MNIAHFLKRLGKDNSGATAIEYGLIVSLIVIAIIGALNSFAGESIRMWGTVTNEYQQATQG